MVALALLIVPFILEAQQLAHPLHVLIMICLYATLAQAWNILGGYAGQVSLGNAVYFGTGAYTSTLLMTRLGLSPWLGIPAGMVVAVALSVAIGYPCFRLGGHYFAIATIAVGEIVHTVFINWREVGGASGIHLPLLPEALINFQFHSSKLPYYYIAFGMAALAFGSAFAVERSRLGYYLGHQGRPARGPFPGGGSYSLQAVRHRNQRGPNRDGRHLLRPVHPGDRSRKRAAALAVRPDLPGGGAGRGRNDLGTTPGCRGVDPAL